MTYWNASYNGKTGPCYYFTTVVVLGPKRWNKSWIPHKVIWSTRETTHEYHKLMSKPNLQVFAHVRYLKQQYTACSLQRQYHQLYISKESVLFMSKASFCKANFKPNIPLPNPATAFTIWQTHAKKQNWSKTYPYWWLNFSVSNWLH